MYVRSFNIRKCDIWGFHSNVTEISSLLGYDAGSFTTLRRYCNLLNIGKHTSTQHNIQEDLIILGVMLHWKLNRILLASYWAVQVGLMYELVARVGALGWLVYIDGPVHHFNLFFRKSLLEWIAFYCSLRAIFL